MPTFLTSKQKDMVAEIADMLVNRSEKIAVAESTSGGLISAALLSFPGASKYYAGGGVVYTLTSRVEIAGVSPEEYANYRGTTEELLASLVKSMREKIGADWCIGESGIAGPAGGRNNHTKGRTVIGVSGPISRTTTIETDTLDRETNMIEFTTESLVFLRDAIKESNVS
tara:strand:+ start:409 stop:918 length:510 start_codon:yes stop_codon:yes gene_type:complete